MKQWNITYYNESVRKEILALPDTLVAKYIKLSNLMVVYGANLGMPHTKSLLVMACLSLNLKVWKVLLEFFIVQWLDKKLLCYTVLLNEKS